MKLLGSKNNEYATYLHVEGIEVIITIPVQKHNHY